MLKDLSGTDKDAESFVVEEVKPDTTMYDMSSVDEDNQLSRVSYFNIENKNYQSLYKIDHETKFSSKTQKDDSINQETSLGVHLTYDDIDKMHLDFMNTTLQQIKQQMFHGAIWPQKYCFGYTAIAVVVLLGLIMGSLGSIILILDSNAVEISRRYGTEDRYVDLDLTDESKWNSKNPGFLAFKVTNMYDGFRFYFNSRPQELFGSYSCGDHIYKKSLLNMRKEQYLPPFDWNNLSSDSKIFPCGASSFAIFADNIEVYKVVNGAEKPVLFNASNLTQNYKYILFAQTGRPEHLSSSNDWYNVTSHMYRNWLEPQIGNSKFLPIGNFQELLDHGKYRIKLLHNGWPDSLWKAEKHVIFYQKSALGTSHHIIGITFLINGLFTLSVAFIMYILLINNYSISTNSSLLLSEKDVEKVLNSLSIRHRNT